VRRWLIVLSRAVVAPIPAHAIPVGINDGFHGVLPPEVFAADCPHMIRTPQLSGEALQRVPRRPPAAPVPCSRSSRRPTSRSSPRSPG
jgi:hypothetical protein